MSDDKPILWIIDSARTPLAASCDAFGAWARYCYYGPDDAIPNPAARPDAVFFSAEIPGGAEGERFDEIAGAAGGAPLLAVSGLRSLAQAVAYFRAGASDFLSLPLDDDDARERFAAAIEKADRQALSAVMVELEALDGDAGDIRLSLALAGPDDDHEDILADLPPPVPVFDNAPAPAELPGDDPPMAAPEEGEAEEPGEGKIDEPEAVDGLPIPTLWEELPCGLVVFDSSGNLVFSNTLALELFGHASMAELQDALENRISSFAAHGANQKPLPDNQWPHALARKARAARSSVVSVERPDKRRVWLRIDCLPHLSEGKITRLSMTLVNLTGELPPLAPAESEPAKPARKKGKRKGKNSPA